MSALSDAELAEIRARADAATGGGWYRDASNSAWILGRGPDAPNGEFRSQTIAETGGVGWASNAEFIAHARTDVPRLLDALQEARSELHYELTGDCPGCEGRGIIDSAEHKCASCGGRGYRVSLRALLAEAGGDE